MKKCFPINVLSASVISNFDPMDFSPLGSSVHRILHARILEWVAMPFSKESSQSTNPCLLSLWHWQVGSLPLAPPGELSSKYIFLKTTNLSILSFPGGSDGKSSAYNAGDPGSIPGSGSSPGEVNGNPLQYSCLENPMDGEAW